MFITFYKFYATALQEANNKKAQSIDGKLNTLKTTVNQMWSNLLSSDGVKGTIDGLTKLVETFGNLKGVLAIATTAFLVWKGVAIQGMLSKLPELIANLVEYQMALGATSKATALYSGVVNTAKFSIIGLTEAMALNPFGAIAITITGAIALLSLLNGQIKSTKELLTDLDSNLNDLSSSKKDEVQLERMKELQKQLKDNTLTTEQQKTAKEELLSIEKQFASTYKNTITGINAQGEEISSNTKLIEQQITAKRRLASINARDDYNKLMKKNNLLGDDPKLNAYGNITMSTYKDSGIYEFEQLNKKFQKGKVSLTDGEKSSYKEYLEQINGINEAVMKLYNSGESIKGAKIFDFESNKLVDATTYINKMKSEEDKATQSTKDLDDGINKLGDDTKSTADTMEDLGKKYSDALGKQKDAVDLQGQLNEAGKLTPEIIQKALELYPDMGASVFDVATMQEYLNKKIEEQKEVQRRTYADMIKDDSTFFNDKVKNTDTYKNFQAQVMTILAQMNNSYYNSNADGMRTELENAQTLGQSRVAIENKVIEALGVAWSNYYKKVAKATEFTVNGQTLHKNMYDEHGQVLPEYKAMVDQLEQQTALARQLQQASDSLSSGVGGIVMPDFSSTDFSTDGGGKDKSATDYTVKDLESMRNAFYNLNNAIDDVKNASDRLSKQIETAYGKDKENLIENRINLLRQEKDLTQQLMNQYGAEIWNKRVELDSKVRSMGSNIGFDSSGNITNRNEMLEALRESVNAMGSYDDASKQAKESAQENVKEIETLISSYDELQNGLASTTSSYDDLTSSIREAYKSMADSVVDGESKIAEVIKNAWQNKLDTVTKYADQLKEKINSTYEQNSYEDDKAKAEKELLDIKQAMNEAVKSGDKELFNTLKKQYQDQQDSINSMIKDKEKDNALNAIDKDTQKFQDAMDEALKPENLTKSITTALQQGYIVVGGEVQKLSDATTQYLKDTQTGTETLTLAMDEYTKSLASALEMYSKINDINNNLGVVTSYTPSNAVNDVNKNWNSIVSQNSVSRAVNISMPINISSVNGVDDLQDQLQDWANTIYKTIDYQLGVK